MVKKLVYKNGLYLTLFVISLIAYHFTYGLHTLNPKNIGWLLNAYHDWGQHYLGAAFYRQEEWHFPLGQMNSFYYPVGTNVGFTDCTPIIAFLTKIFSFLLPEDFQYFGIWLFSCMFLNAFFTVKILKLFNANNLIIILCSTLVLVNPLLIFRGMQASACAHWLFLGSFYYYLKPTDKLSVIVNFKKQSVLMLLSTLINPYLSIMTAGFVVILVVKNYFYDHSLTLKRVIVLPIITFTLTLFIWIVFGMIEFGNKTDLDVGSIYGTIYSFNLNSFLNSYGFYSKFIPHLGMIDDTQHEGFAYLGLGMIVLIISTIAIGIFYSFTKKLNKKHYYILPLVVLCIIMLLFAITNVVTLGTEVLFKYPTLGIIQKAGNIFRATGRFSWPFYYLLYILSFIIFSKIKMNQIIKIFFLISILSLQIYDTENLITSRNLKSGGFDSKLDEEKWKLIIDNFDEILTYPPYSNNMVYPMDYQDLMFVALKSKKPISIGYVARENVTAGMAYRDTLYKRIKNGEISKKQVFVTNKENIKDFDVLIYKDKVNLKKLDGFIFVYSKEATLSTEYIEKASNVFFVDSLRKTIQNTSKVRKTQLNFESVNDIQYNIEKFIFEDDVMEISGWAFNKAVNSNKSDSLFIGFKTINEVYMYPMNNFERKDISLVYKKDLDNAGFKATIFTDKLPKNNYELIIIIKNSKGNYLSAETEKLSSIKPKKYKEPNLIELKGTPNNFMFNLESLIETPKVTTMSGWAAIKDIDATNNKITILLKSDSYIYEIESDPVVRNDVTIANGNTYNYNNSGFNLQFLNKNIKKGNYKVGIKIENNEKNILFFNILERKISF